MVTLAALKSPCKDSNRGYIGCVKTTIDIPEELLKEAMRFTHATTKRDAVVTALTDFNRRQSMAALSKHLGTCKNLITPEELSALRESA